MTGIMQVIVGASYLSSPVNTVAPAVTGTVQSRQTLSTTTGTWTGSPTSYSYQWKRGATNVGANSDSYTLVTADVGSTMTCVVTATNAVGSTNATSGTTGTVSANVPLAPTIGTATATAYNTATVQYSAPSDNGGATITSYTATSSPGGITGTLSTAGSGTITVSGLTQSTSYTFTVKANNSVGASSASSASNSRTTPIAPPTTIGQAFAGGYYAGKISTTANGVATHYLIVAPVTVGYNGRSNWFPYSPPGISGASSQFNGAANTDAIVASGGTAAVVCRSYTFGGYTDWYLPSRCEQEIAYYFLKPTSNNNSTAYGANPYAVLPEPYNTNHTSSSPARTSSSNFVWNGLGDQPYFPDNFWTSTLGYNPWTTDFGIGAEYQPNAANLHYFRAMRKVAI
jgi:hypothetical protein